MMMILKDPDMCDVAEFNQQVREDFQSIVHEQPDPVYDSYTSNASMEEENHFVNSQDDIVVDTVEGTCERIHDKFATFYFQCLENLHSLFSAEQMKYHFISEAEQQCDFLYQLEIQHSWEDPVAIYMKSRFSKGFSLLEIEIKVEYAVQIKFVFQMINSSLISIYLQEVVTDSWMLSWLHWKYDYTLLVCFYQLEVGVGRRISSPYKHVDHFQYFGL